VYFYGTRQSLFLPSANKIHSAKKLSKKNLKIPNGLEKLPKFHVKQSMLSIAYTKSFELKNNSTINLTPILIGSFSTL